jgi:hypothetical protein
MKFVLRLLVSAAVIFGVAYLSGGWLLQVDTSSRRSGPHSSSRSSTRSCGRSSDCSRCRSRLTLGLFALVVNALMIYLVAWIVPGVETTGFFQTIVAAIIISVVTAFFSAAIDKSDPSSV